VCVLGNDEKGSQTEVRENSIMVTPWMIRIVHLDLDTKIELVKKDQAIPTPFTHA